eukprot:scaffold34366_cov23-Cyclotella_meneghiniana.AAC.3
MAYQAPERGAKRTGGEATISRSKRRHQGRIGRVVERRTGGKTTINRRFDSPLKRELAASSP